MTWKSAYLNTRKEIEVSGRGSRWEFDRRDIFNDTEYIIKVCEDLNQMANVAEDFYNIFGDEMKSIIKIRSLVDLMLENIDKLIAPIRVNKKFKSKQYWCIKQYFILLFLGCRFRYFH